MVSPSNYRLRALQPGNMADIERINLMFYHPQVMKAKGYYHLGFTADSPNDLLEYDKQMFLAKDHITRRKDDVILAVTGQDSGILGWIWFYRDSRHPLPRRIKTDLKINERNSRIYQLSYEKLLENGWPAKLLTKTEHVTPRYLMIRRKGVIVEGLRLAINKLRREFRALYEKRKMLVLYGFVDPTNVASGMVMRRNRFTLVSQKYKYDGQVQDLWVRIV